MDESGDDLNLTVFVHIREAGTGRGYRGWQAFSGYSIGLESDRHLWEPQIANYSDIDWAKAYRTYFRHHLVEIRTSGNATVEGLIANVVKGIRAPRTLGFKSLAETHFELHQPSEGYEPLSPNA